MTEVDPATIGEDDARAAGFASLADLAGLLARLGRLGRPAPSPGGGGSVPGS